MNDTERVIGELQEFKRATLKEMTELKNDVRELLAFRWKQAGVYGFLLATAEVLHLVWDKIPKK
jgi:hypothetical protein